MKTFARVLCVTCLCALPLGCEKTTVEGPAGKKLTVVKPMASTIKQGSSDKVAVVVTRTNFDGPVQVQFEALPKGVTLVDSDRNIEGNERTFVLEASPTADLVENHVAKITVTAPDGMSATQEFSVTVKAKG